MECWTVRQSRKEGTMLVYASRPGQLGNCLFYCAHLLFYAIEQSYKRRGESGFWVRSLWA
jgi:hypothetical protein